MIFFDDLLHNLLNWDLDDLREKNELIKLTQEPENDLNLGPKSGVVFNQEIELLDQKIQIHLDVLRQEVVLLLVSGHIDTNCNTQTLSLNNFVNVFQNLDYLRHNHDLLDYLLQNVRHLHQFLFLGMDFHWLLFVPIDNLENLLNVVDVLDNLLELLHDNCLFHNLLYFMNLWYSSVHFNNSFFLLFNLLDPLDDQRHFHNLLYHVLNVLLYLDQLGN